MQKEECRMKKPGSMKTKHLLQSAGLTLVSAFSLQPSALFAQGGLTPPGAPAPAMKTLDQVYVKLDPRTAITNAASGYTINAPGSYYLAANLTVSSGDGITITTNGVTLDLNGFTISSTAPSATGYGILLNGGLSDLTIFNGHIRGGVTNNGSGVYGGSGFQYGIHSAGTAPVNTRVTGVSVAGCLAHGIYLGTGDSTVVESCTVRTMGGSGIVASTIKSSVAVDCRGTAVYGDQVSDSRGECTGDNGGDNFGLRATTALNCYGSTGGGHGTGLDAATALNCYGYSSFGASTGLHANTALNCYGANSNNGHGLDASDVAIGCRGYSASGTGLWAYIANSCRVAGGTTNITYKYNMP